VRKKDHEFIGEGLGNKVRCNGFFLCAILTGMRPRNTAGYNGKQIQDGSCLGEESKWVPWWRDSRDALLMFGDVTGRTNAILAREIRARFGSLCLKWLQLVEGDQSFLIMRWTRRHVLNIWSMWDRVKDGSSIQTRKPSTFKSSSTLNLKIAAHPVLKCNVLTA
jgi:hypothetical protein